MDQSKHQTERDKFRSIFQQAFPDLEESYEILEPSNSQYNCIAHAIGIHHQWIMPQTGSSDEPLALMDDLFGKYGYERMADVSWECEPDAQKVVLYARTTDEDVIEEVTHAAFQDSTGTWESKVGQGPLIRHTLPEALNGPLYGEPVAIYIKQENR